jgi:hypothetical protein
MAIEILETTVSETGGATVVQIFVSDRPRGEIGASFRLDLLATLPLYLEPLFAQIQREAMKAAQDALTPILQKLANEISAHHRLQPDRK